MVVGIYYFLNQKLTQLPEGLIVDIGSKAVEKSKFILESHDKRDTIETIRHKIEEEYCGKFAIYKTRCEEKDKMIEMLEEQLASARNQNEMNSITLTQLSVGLENRMTKIDDTCSTLSSHLEMDKGKRALLI